MHLITPWFHHSWFTSLEPTRPMPTSSRESGLFSVQGNTTAVLSSTESTAYTDFFKSKIHQLKQA